MNFYWVFNHFMNRTTAKNQCEKYHYSKMLKITTSFQYKVAKSLVLEREQRFNFDGKP